MVIIDDYKQVSLFNATAKLFFVVNGSIVVLFDWLSINWETLLKLIFFLYLWRSK